MVSQDYLACAMARSNMVVVVLSLLVVLLCGESLGRKQSPLIPAEGGKGRSRATECQFGKQLKELGTSWFADLGPPFGVMYCIRCQCVPVQKKRRIVARVQCKNIKNECPAPTCDEPVLLPGHCCKMCPQDHMDSPGIARDVAPVQTPEEEERNMRHFAALLTGRTSMVLHRDDAVMSSSPISHQEALVATARFTFHKKHLYYSFYTSALVRPRALQFVDHEGNILEEQALGETEYGNHTGKTCGVWRRVPREYRRILREERMLVTLMWPDNVSLSGLVVRYRTLSTELFSSLLDIAPGADRTAMSGAGGSAIVSASSSAPTVHIHLTFNGVFSPLELYDVPITVRLEAADRQHVVLEEVVHVSKPAHELNEVEVVSPVTTADLRHLTRGKLRLVIENKKNPEMLRLEGRVQTRVTCEVFQCLLSSADSDGEDEDSSTLTPASGVGLFYVNREGALVYNVQLDSLDSRPAALLTLGLVSGRGKRRLELEDLTPSLVSNNATGTLDRMSPKELEQLYAGDLALNVATESASSLLRGRLAGRPVADARTSPVPVLLRRQETDSPAGVTGLAWVAVDMECTLHYELLLSGLPNEDRPLELYWEELPFIALFAPISRRLLEEFSGSSLEGFMLGLSPEELARIENSVNYLEVREATGLVLLRTPILKVHVPSSCLPHYTDNSVPAAPSDPGGNDITACYHDDRFHDDGSQWPSKQDHCAMCSCQRGRVVCDSMSCPALACAHTQTLAGECCPVCVAGSSDPSGNVTGRGCFLAGQFHMAGSSWHPYLPPNGFDTCAVCSCDNVKMNVRCSRVRCPPLACDEHRAFRPDKKACCKQCPEPPPVVENKDGFAKDEQDPWTREDVLAAGGCEYIAGKVVRNGDEWNPRVPPSGEDKCIKCRCKDGKVQCDRKRCSKPPCSKEDACCHQCRRMHTRHHKEKHFN